MIRQCSRLKKLERNRKTDNAPVIYDVDTKTYFGAKTHKNADVVIIDDVGWKCIGGQYVK